MDRRSFGLWICSDWSLMKCGLLVQDFPVTNSSEYFVVDFPE
jgi:hypothetical protein